MNKKFVIISNIRKIINDKGLKQYVVAERCGYTDKQFSDLLNNRKVITADDIGRLYIGLGVTPNELFGYDESA